MKCLIGAILLFIIAGAGCKQKEQPAVHEAPGADVPVEVGEPDYANLPALKYEFEAQRTGNSMAFKSVLGAKWKEVSYACKELPCKFDLNEDGVNQRGTSVFIIAFTVTAKEVGMEAISMRPRIGSSWETIKYACEPKGCRFKVNQDGVTGL
ncbi:MAG: hypothetical protein ACYC2I_00300 [Elusimicrobiales bacterium]